MIVLDEQGNTLEQDSVEHESYQLQHQDWLLTHVAIEMHDGLLLERLLRFGVHVYGLNPKSAERANGSRRRA